MIRRALRQVLLNLLSNAVKFTDDGEVVLHMEARATRARTRVASTSPFATRGSASPQDRMDRLFASFSQVDASTTRRYGGTGLGLAISKRLVELMGGTLWVESEFGKGSTFHIELDVREAEVPARIEERGHLPQLDGRRILVVDDNATNREVVIRQTRSWGMEPVAVEGPLEALALLDEGKHFDVAVLDLVMPDMDGLELAREIRRRRDARELPLLLLTSLGRPRELRSAKEFAAQLTKPIKASQLYNALAVRSRRVTCRRRPRSNPTAAANDAQAGNVVLADPPRRGQCGEPEGRARDSGSARLSRGRRLERPRGAGGARAAAVRRRPDGCPDARARRPRRHASDLRTLAPGASGRASSP